MLTRACSAVLATPMLVVMLVIVSVNAEMLASCDRAAMANPSLTPMPASVVDFSPVASCVDRFVSWLLRFSPACPRAEPAYLTLLLAIWMAFQLSLRQGI